MNSRGNVMSLDASAAWAETITALAERQRERRALDVGNRWPAARSVPFARSAGPSPDRAPTEPAEHAPL